MKLGLICADLALRQQAVGQITVAADLDLAWYCSTALQAAAERQVALVLVAAAQVDCALIAALNARGTTLVVAVARTLSMDCEAVYSALDAGATGFIELTRLQAPGELHARLLRLRGTQLLAAAALPPLIVLGASAGGPAALRGVLQSLPATLAAAVLVVQHYEGERIEVLGDWLGEGLAVPLQVALDHAMALPGCIYLADTGRHLELAADGRFQCPPRQSGELHCPAINRLFLSLAQQPAAGSAALLTGMGRDGAEGLLALRRAGWFTITQTAASSAVDGMPRAARELDAACAILPLAQIGPALLRQLAAVQKVAVHD